MIVVPLGVAADRDAASASAVAAGNGTAASASTAPCSPVQSLKAPALPALHRVYWILNTISVTVAIGITCTYWVAVYDPSEYTVPAQHAPRAASLLPNSNLQAFVVISLEWKCHQIVCRQETTFYSASYLFRSTLLKSPSGPHWQGWEKRSE